MFKPLAALLLIAALGAAAPQLPPQPKVRPAGMPVGYVMASPCIPQMGEHWVNLKNPKAPIYGTYKGKVIFSEIMVPLKTLNAGFNYSDLQALPGHRIDHVDLDWEPHGHPGMMFPHYDIHAYYITAAQQQQICPNAAGGMAM